MDTYARFQAAIATLLDLDAADQRRYLDKAFAEEHAGTRETLSLDWRMPCPGSHQPAGEQAQP